MSAQHARPPAHAAQSAPVPEAANADLFFALFGGVACMEEQAYLVSGSRGGARFPISAEVLKASGPWGRAALENGMQETGEETFSS